MRFISLLFVLFISNNIHIKAQTVQYQVLLEPLTIPGLEAVQSYAYGQYDGKWLIIGGRTDGLHRRQPFASFSESGNNRTLLVIDPVAEKKWTAPLSSLSIGLQEQLSAANMEFHQDGNFLYIAGGYGYSSTEGDHITFGKLTAIDVPGTIRAIINSEKFTAYFRQISNINFAVTGGHLKKINETYYLVGGQKFMGRYNPMGPDHGPGFSQQYTDQVRKFKINDDGINISIANYETITDPEAFHRRDYNVVPQVLLNGKEGLTLFSGVFQPAANIPFLNSVTLDEKGYKINPSFAQYYNNYHSAVLPLYSKKNNEMHTIFFGGIAQYYDSAGILVQNSDVPFVKTIAAVVRDNTGNLAEYKLPVEMPFFAGAGAELIISPSVPKYANNVIKLDSIFTDTTLAGHIYGGITSKAANIFWVNTGKESEASNLLFKVYIIKSRIKPLSALNNQSSSGLQMQVYANSSQAVLSIQFYLAKQSPVEIQVKDFNGTVLAEEDFKNLPAGENKVHISNKIVKTGQQFWVTVRTKINQATQKIIIEP